MCVTPQALGDYVDLGSASSKSSGFLSGQAITVAATSTLRSFGLITRQTGTNVSLGLYTDVGGNPSALVASAQYGALASQVLAHYPAAPEQPTLIKLITEWGIRGLEVYYRRFTAETIAAMEELAGEKGLIATGGSDYHGDTGTYADAMRTTYVPRAMTDRLLAELAEVTATELAVD